MAHGKANALDIEFCEALAAQFEALRGSDAKARGADRAGHDVFRRRRSHAAERGRRGLCAALSAGAAPALRHGVLLSEARGGRGQRPRHRRRLRAAVLAPTGASPRATAAASASPSCWSACRFRRWRSRSMRFATPPRLFRGDDLERRDLSARDGAGARPGRRTGRAGGAARSRGRRGARRWRRCRPRRSRRPSSRSASRSPTPWSATAARVDAAAEEIWTAPETLDHIRDYVCAHASRRALVQLSRRISFSACTPDLAQSTSARPDGSAPGSARRASRALRRRLAGLIEPLHQRGVAVVQRLGEPIGDVVGQVGPRQDVAPRADRIHRLLLARIGAGRHGDGFEEIVLGADLRHLVGA